MKRVLIGLMVLVLALSLTSVALAAGPKPPTTLAIQNDVIGNEFLLVNVKSMGTVKTSDGPVKTYNITGWQHSMNTFPISGSGYVGTDGIFHFSITGLMRHAGGQFFTQANLSLNLTTGMGTWAYVWTSNGTPFNSGEDAMHVIPSTERGSP